MLAMVRERQESNTDTRRTSSRYIGAELPVFNWVTRMPEDDGWLIVPSYIPQDPFYSDPIKVREYILKYGANKSGSSKSMKRPDASPNSQDSQKSLKYSFKKRNRPQRAASTRPKPFIRSASRNSTYNSITSDNGLASIQESSTTAISQDPQQQQQQSEGPVSRSRYSTASRISSTNTAQTRASLDHSETGSESTVVGHISANNPLPVPPKSPSLQAFSIRHYRQSSRSGGSSRSTPRSRNNNNNDNNNNHRDRHHHRRPHSQLHHKAPEPPSSSPSSSSRGRESRTPHPPSLGPSTSRQYQNINHRYSRSALANSMNRPLPPIIDKNRGVSNNVMNDNNVAGQQNSELQANDDTSLPESLSSNNGSHREERITTTFLRPRQQQPVTMFVTENEVMEYGVDRSTSIYKDSCLPSVFKRPWGNRASVSTSTTNSSNLMANSGASSSAPGASSPTTREGHRLGLPRSTGFHLPSPTQGFLRRRLGQLTGSSGSNESFSLISFRHLSARPRSSSAPSTPSANELRDNYFEQNLPDGSVPNIDDESRDNEADGAHYFTDDEFALKEPLARPMVNDDTHVFSRSTSALEVHPAVRFASEVLESEASMEKEQRRFRGISICEASHILAAKVKTAVRKIKLPICPPSLEDNDFGFDAYGDTSTEVKRSSFMYNQVTATTSMPNMLANESRCEKCGRALTMRNFYVLCQRRHAFCLHCIEAHALPIVESGSLKIPCASVTPCPALISFNELERCFGKETIRYILLNTRNATKSPIASVSNTTQFVNDNSLGESDIPRPLQSPNSPTMSGYSSGTNIQMFAKNKVQRRHARMVSISNALNANPDAIIEISRSNPDTDIEDGVDGDSIGTRPNCAPERKLTARTTTVSTGRRTYLSKSQSVESLETSVSNKDSGVMGNVNAGFDESSYYSGFVTKKPLSGAESGDDSGQAKAIGRNVSSKRIHLESIRLTPMSLSPFPESPESEPAKRESAQSKVSQATSSCITAKSGIQKRLFNRSPPPVPQRTNASNILALAGSRGTWVTPNQVNSGFFNNLDLYADALDYFDSIKPHSRLSDFVMNVSHVRTADQKLMESYLKELEELRDQMAAIDESSPDSVMKAIDKMITPAQIHSPWRPNGLSFDTDLDFLAPSSTHSTPKFENVPKISRSPTAKPRPKRSTNNSDQMRPSITDSSAELWLDALDFGTNVTSLENVDKRIKKGLRTAGLSTSHASGMYHNEKLHHSQLTAGCGNLHSEGYKFGGRVDDPDSDSEETLWYQLSSMSQPDLLEVKRSYETNRSQNRKDGITDQKNGTTRSSASPSLDSDLLEAVQLNADLYVQLQSVYIE